MKCWCKEQRCVRQQLLQFGYVVLERFFQGKDLQTLQLEAEVVLEDAGAYEDFDMSGEDDAVAKRRGCIFEVVRPFRSGHTTCSFATACKADGAAALVAARSSTADSMTTFRAMMSTSAAIRLPSLGLLTSPSQLHCLVRSALGFPPCHTGQVRCCDAGSCGSEPHPSQHPKDIRHYTADLDTTSIVSTHDNGDCSDQCRPEAPCLTSWGLPEASASDTPATARDSADAAISADVSKSRPAPPPSPRAALAVASIPPLATAPGPRGEGPYLFNEQFIVKPSSSSSAAAFGWHRDSDWCRGRQEYEYSPYVSVWVALDDMTADNGALAVLPGSHVASGANGAGDAVSKGRQPPEHLFVPAGTAVVFMDTLLHASGPNYSLHMRRAWMAQFSALPILRRIDRQPVALAVPLSVLHMNDC
ncbi:hypothetical protein Vafri_18519 [Volvox africanus]|uniref:Phytanoyl-CoA dioxygenase n=1 Tax=Volvox africanus TaxID=51714 RepID=A0A8J4BM81_9CHLO|nr:hypothetical protein Vafri_18519 [Volvox africanus]